VHDLTCLFTLFAGEFIQVRIFLARIADSFGIHLLGGGISSPYLWLR
jgi:hypothetical protein